MRISHNTFITYDFSVEFAVGDSQYTATFKPVMDEDWYFGDRHDVQLSLVNFDEYGVGEVQVRIYEKFWDEKSGCYLFDPDAVINHTLKDPVKINISKGIK